MYELMLQLLRPNGAYVRPDKSIYAAIEAVGLIELWDVCFMAANSDEACIDRFLEMVEADSTVAS